jgi:hypothetical protein
MEIEQGYIYIHYNDKISKVLLDKKNMVGISKNILITQIDSKKKKEYYIEYSSGPSADPKFMIKVKTANGGFKIIKRLSGTEIFIPGSGKIYISGHTNNMFNSRKKYVLKDELLEEVIQPFYYVGLKTVTTQMVKIYSSKLQKNIVAILPEKSQVEVILNEGEFYLLKTPFGLLGWARVPESLSTNSPLKGLYFAGD